ncbi:UNVERIFIED_CONTAM: hypothetical protein NCL1_29275 [Trichonephila clavipes]
MDNNRCIYQMMQKKVNIASAAMHKIIQEELLMRKNDGGHRNISKIVTGDETCYDVRDVPTRQECKVWVFEDVPPTAMVKRQRKTKNHQVGRTVTANWYTSKCLPEILQEVNKEDFLSRNESSCAVEQFHSDASLKAVDRRVPNNSKNWQWKVRKVRSARDDQQLLHKVENDHTASSRQLATHESRFNLWDHDGRIRVRRYADERCLPECIIELNSGITPKVIVWGAISYDGRSDFLRIKVNINSSRYVHEVLQPEVIPFPQGISGAIFQQDIALPHVAKTVRDFCSAQNMQLLP